MNKFVLVIISLLLFLSLFLRSYNLNWGAPYYFHPDERNIASSVTQLILPHQMNPHFFAYGSLPIYVVYFSNLFVEIPSIMTHNQSSFQVQFNSAIFTLRFYSLIFSVLTVILVFFLCTKYFNKHIAYIATFLTAFSIGLIQYSHFGTYEMWLTFFSLLLCYFCINYSLNSNKKNLLYIGITFGILISIKISSLPLLLCIISSICISYISHHKKITFFNILRFCVLLITPIAISILIFVLTNPFSLLDFTAFRSSISYESSVATGTLPVFYTGEFFNTTPILYQVTTIYPFLITPLLTIIFLITIFFTVLRIVKKREIPLFIVTLFFFILFISQSIFFVKWTRYLIPTLPFIYILIGIFAFYILKIKTYKFVIKIAILLLAVYLFSYSLLFTFVTYNNDSRIQAYEFAKIIIPKEAQILSEVYDLGIIPFNDYYPNITLFNFYELDNHGNEKVYTSELLEYTEYIILPSQRIIKTRTENKQQFPNGYEFYSQLLNGDLGYKRIYTSPCDFLCTLLYGKTDGFMYEGTSQVFDRPTFYIFKKDEK